MQTLRLRLPNQLYLIWLFGAVSCTVRSNRQPLMSCMDDVQGGVMLSRARVHWLNSWDAGPAEQDRPSQSRLAPCFLARNMCSAAPTLPRAKKVKVLRYLTSRREQLMRIGRWPATSFRPASARPLSISSVYLFMGQEV